MEDAFQAILDAMEPDTPSAEGLVMGKVSAAEPLKVLVGGNTMERVDLLCNADLLTRDPAWENGDRLLLLPIEDAQRYLILCKVVDL